TSTASSSTVATTPTNTKDSLTKNAKGDSNQKDSSDDESSKHSDDSQSVVNNNRDGKTSDQNESDEEEQNEREVTTATTSAVRRSGSKNQARSTGATTSNNEEDTFLEKFQQQQRKREKLETKAKISHRVFCPFFPEIKQECWWLYVADRKHHTLISAPVYLCTLKDEEEVSYMTNQLAPCDSSYVG
ncbi:unnamed protein product, partial [Didymodactylos carnosus]